jgi:predicted transcriptional regulator
MAVSFIMLDVLRELYKAEDYSIPCSRIRIADKTYNALKYRGYINTKDGYYYLTENGLKYLKRYHNKRIDL